MVNEPERLPTTNECGRHLLHVAREHLISPMRFCLACLASKSICGKSAALHMAKSDVGGLRGATNTACASGKGAPC